MVGKFLEFLVGAFCAVAVFAVAAIAGFSVGCERTADSIEKKFEIRWAVEFSPDGRYRAESFSAVRENATQFPFVVRVNDTHEYGRRATLFSLDSFVPHEFDWQDTQTLTVRFQQPLPSNAPNYFRESALGEIDILWETP